MRYFLKSDIVYCHAMVTFYNACMFYNASMKKYGVFIELGILFFMHVIVLLYAISR